MKQAISQKDIQRGFEELGLVGKQVLIHSSLSSFGHVEGGAKTIIKECIRSFKTVMMPAFCWDSNTKPLAGDRPTQNGCDYAFYDGWNKPLKPFLVESAGIEPSMGIISRDFINVAGVKRSDHAWHSWAAYGDQSEELIKYHRWDTTNLPIERLAKMGGHLLLMGVGLSSCTAIHVAEEKAGRNAFIRWAVNREGQVQRVRAAGCAKGFDTLMPRCNALFKEIKIGNSTILTTPLSSFIQHVSTILLSEPEITVCSNTCIRCQDALLGGVP